MSVMAVLLHALRLLVTDGPEDLHLELEMTRELYLRMLTARRALSNAGEWVPDGLPTLDGRNSPTPDTAGTAAERKLPDIQWGYQDDLEPDPQRSARFFHVECKRLGGADLNSRYVDDGVIRFASLEHRYGKDVREGAMIGYLVEGRTSDALADVNQRSATAGLPEVLLVSDNDYVSVLESTLDREFPKSPFKLHHAWVVIYKPLPDEIVSALDESESVPQPVMTSL